MAISETGKALSQSDAGAGSSGFGTVGAGLDIVGSAVGFGIGERERKKSRKARKQALEKWERETTDLSYRREATYRYERQRISNALEEMYKQRGWALPEKKEPGYGTTRPLPGEGPLYPEDTATYPRPKASSSGSEAQQIVSQMEPGEMSETIEPGEIVDETMPESADVDVAAEETIQNRKAFTSPASVGADAGGEINVPSPELEEEDGGGKKPVNITPQEEAALTLLRRRRF